MKEDLIIEWFQSWFDSHWNNFEVIFESDACYSESWGPEYKGIIEIKKWFNDWLSNCANTDICTMSLSMTGTNTLN